MAVVSSFNDGGLLVLEAWIQLWEASPIKVVTTASGFAGTATAGGGGGL